MTEKKTDYFASGVSLPPLPAVSMQLMRAGRIAGFDGRDGWPQAFTPKELAALQYPDDKDKQNDLIALLTPMIYRHEIESVTVMRPPLFWIGGVPETYKEIPEPAITRLAAIAFLNGINEEPGELVREWLGREWQPAQAPESAGSEAASKANETPPGTLPAVACGALAVKAAWQIERETKSLATAKHVIKRLQEWADSGKESDCLIRSLAGYAVEWWAKGVPKTYDLDACRTTLRRWNESRKSGQ